MAVHFYDAVDDIQIRFSVIIVREKGQWVLCKHKARQTLEFPGGHRELGETPEETARRELWEETGATDFTLSPVCVYGVRQPGKDESFGMLFCAEIIVRDAELHSEIEKVFLFDTPPDNWTYPDTQPYLMKEVCRRGLF